MVNINKLYDISMEIKNTIGKKAKESILIKYKNDEEWKQFLSYVFDKNKIYGLQVKKIQKHSEMAKKVCSSFVDLFNLFEYLLVNNTGRDLDAKKVAQFIYNQDEQYHEFLLEAITKKLKLGVESTITKMYPEIFETFEVMRGKSYHDYKDKVKGKEFIITEKKNGIRCIAIKDGDNITFKTRQNKVIEGLNGIREDLLKINGSFILDGELLIKNDEQYSHREVLQETLKIVNSDIEDKVVNYWVFDCLNHGEFNMAVDSRKYFDRRKENPLNEIELEHVKMIPVLYQGKDLTEIDRLLDLYVDEMKREGLMLNLNAPLKKNKTHHILKVKKRYTSDLQVTGFEEGSGKYKNTLGALVLDYKGYKLKCSGMSDTMRYEIWHNKDKYLGKFIELSHEQETTNEKGGISLEYPAFERWRDDINEPSYAHE